MYLLYDLFSVVLVLETKKMVDYFWMITKKKQIHDLFNKFKKRKFNSVFFFSNRTKCFLRFLTQNKFYFNLKLNN